MSQEEEILKLVGERKSNALTTYMSYFQRVRRWYDLYRGIYTGRYNSFRNNVHIPLIFSIIQSDVARKVQTSFGSWPIVEFSGYSLDDEANAKRNETLISAQMKDADSFKKAVDFYTQADCYGTAFARDGWSNITRLHKWRQKMGNAEIIRSDQITTFDGPDWEVVDVLDLWPQPGKKFLKDAAWVIHRYYLDFDDIEDMQSGPIPMFDKNAVARLKQIPMGTTENDMMIQRRNVYRSYSEFQARATERFAKPVEITEMWGLVPSEFAPDGVRNRVVTVANGQVVLRNEGNPYWHLEKPFHAYSPMPDPHYLHGVGKAEICEKLQGAGNKLINQKLDAGDIFGSPMFIASRSAGLNGDSLIARPGRLFQVDGPADQLQPLPVNLSGISAINDDLGMLWNYMQQGTGIIEDVVMGGGGGPSRETAFANRGRQESVMTRIMLETRLAEEGFVEPLANRFRYLNRQWLTLPHERKILGSSATINPITGLPLPQEPTIIDLEDVNPDYRARAVGATQMLGKSARRQDIMALLQATTATQPLAQMTNWAAFGNQLYKIFDFNPIEMLVNTVPAITQHANMVGQSPEDIAMAAMNGSQGGPGLDATGSPATQPPAMQMMPQVQPSMFGGG